MRVENRCLENRCLENRCFENRCLQNRCVENRCVENRGVEKRCLEKRCSGNRCVENRCLENRCFENRCFENRCLENRCLENREYRLTLGNQGICCVSFPTQMSELRSCASQSEILRIYVDASFDVFAYSGLGGPEHGRGTAIFLQHWGRKESSGCHDVKRTTYHCPRTWDDGSPGSLEKMAGDDQSLPSCALYRQRGCTRIFPARVGQLIMRTLTLSSMPSLALKQSLTSNLDWTGLQSK